MIFVDVETSGLDSHKCAILSIGAVEYENPSNICYIKCAPWQGAYIDSKALEVNGFNYEEIWTIPYTQRDAIIKFDKWVKSVDNNEEISGYNYQRFDDKFIKEAYKRELDSEPEIQWTIIDVMDIYKKSDLYNHKGAKLDDLLDVLGLRSEPHPHHALRGAMLELEAYSRLTQKKSVFKNRVLYKKFHI